MIESLFAAYLQLSLAITPVLLLLWSVVRAGKAAGTKAMDSRLFWCVIFVQLLLPLAGPVLRPIGLSQPEDIQYTGEPYVQDTIYTILTAVWLVGAAVKILRQTGGHIRFMRLLEREGAAVPEGQGILEALCRMMDIRRPPKLIRCALADSPMLCGWCRTVIVLPEIYLTEEELQSVLRHELFHLRQGDGFWKRLAMLGGAVHWYNPLVQWAIRRFALVTELACDEAVLARMDDRERLAYGEVVLAILRQKKTKTGGAGESA